MRKALITVSAALACTALVGCGGDKGIKLGTDRTVGNAATYSIEAADQTSNGKAIKLPSVHTKDKGYIAVHADAEGAPGPVIGVSELLEAGETEDVRIKLTDRLDDSASVWPMLHIEDNGNTTYDFPNGDAPAKVDNQVVVVKIAVTVR